MGSTSHKSQAKKKMIAVSRSVHPAELVSVCITFNVKRHSRGTLDREEGLLAQRVTNWQGGRADRSSMRDSRTVDS